MKIIGSHKSLFARTAGIGVLITITSALLLLLGGHSTGLKIERMVRDEADAYFSSLQKMVEIFSEDLFHDASELFANNLAREMAPAEAIRATASAFDDRGFGGALLWYIDNKGRIVSSQDTSPDSSFIESVRKIRQVGIAGCNILYANELYRLAVNDPEFPQSDSANRQLFLAAFPLTKLYANVDRDNRIINISINSKNREKSNAASQLASIEKPLNDYRGRPIGRITIAAEAGSIAAINAASWETMALGILPILGFLLFGYLLYRYFESFANHSNTLRGILKREKPGLEVFRRDQHVVKNDMPELSEIFGLIEESVDEKSQYKKCLEIFGASLSIIQEKGYDNKTLNDIIEVIVEATNSFGGAAIAVDFGEDRVEVIGKYNFEEEIVSAISQTSVGMGFIKYSQKHDKLFRFAHNKEDQPEEPWKELFKKYRTISVVPLVFKAQFKGVLILTSLETEASQLLTDHFAAMLGHLLGTMFYGITVEGEKSARHDKTRILQETSLAISSTLDLPSVLHIVATRLTDYSGATYCLILLNTALENVMEVASFHAKRQDSIAAPETSNINIMEFPKVMESLSSKRTLVLGPQEIADFSPGEKRFFRTDAAKLLTIIPIFHSAKSIGAVILGEERSRLRGTLAPDKFNFVQAIVSQAASAIENARLYGFIKHKVDQLTALYNVSAAIHSEVEIISMLDKVLSASRDYLHFTAAAVFAYDGNSSKALRLLALNGLNRKDSGDLRKAIASGRNIVPLLVATDGEARIIDDYRVEVGLESTFPQTLSELAVPIMIGQRVIGIYSIGSDTRSAFGEVDADFLKALAAQIAVAMEKATLFEQEKQRGIKLKTIFEFSRKLSKSLNVGEVLRIATESIQEAFGYQLVAVFLIDQIRQQFFIGHQSSFTEKSLPGDFTVPLGHGLLGECISTRKTKYSSDVYSDPNYVPAISDVQSEICIPIIVADRIVGVLDVESMNLDAFALEDIKTLEALADIMAVAIDNSYLFEETIQKAERLSLIDNINKAISATLDLDSFFRVVAKAVADNAGYRWTSLVIPDNGSFLFKAGYTPKSVGVISTEIMLDLLQDKLRLVIDNSAPEFVSFSQLMKLGAPEKLQSIVDAGIRNLALFPIGDNTQAEAVMIVGTSRTDGFTNQELSLLRDLAVHLRIAWQNAQLYQQLKTAYEQLQEAQDRVVQTEKLRALGEMSSGVVHDFNNVLAAILGRIQIISKKLKGFGEWPGRNFLERNLELMEKAANDGSQILSRISEFTKKKPSEKFVIVHIDQIIIDTIELTRPRWREQARSLGKSITIEMRRTEPLQTTGSPSELREVFINLINNAVDAIEGDGRIIIDAWLESDKVIKVAVEDNGHGMALETRKKIFEPFFTTKGASGTGLGLSVTYGIITRHRGQIEVNSEPGRGTKFIITIPVRDGSDDETKSLEVVRPETEPAKILVVDDEDGFRDIIVEILSSGGHHAESASCAADALERLNARKFDIVITDLGMAGLSGWELADKIHKNHPDTRIIMATGWGANLEPDKLNIHHVDKLMCKPFKIEEILMAVSELLAAAKNGAFVGQK